jgi:hypothetical protein
MLDVNSTLVSRGDGLAIHREQTISDEFLDHLDSERLAASTVRAQDNLKVASVPVSVVEIWLRQGFDIYSAKPRDIVARLRKDGLDAFVTTNKKI